MFILELPSSLSPAAYALTRVGTVGVVAVVTSHFVTTLAQVRP